MHMNDYATGERQSTDNLYHQRLTPSPSRVLVPDWWAALSQKAPYGDSGPKVLTLAADLQRVAPQPD
jgi:hypothetical protein